MIIYKANDKGFVTEICIMKVSRIITLESAKPYHEIQHYRTTNDDVELESHGSWFTLYLPFDNHFHKMSYKVTIEEMKLFDNCYNVNERIPIC